MPEHYGEILPGSAVGPVARYHRPGGMMCPTIIQRLPVVFVAKEPHTVRVTHPGRTCLADSGVRTCMARHHAAAGIGGPHILRRGQRGNEQVTDVAARCRTTPVRRSPGRYGDLPPFVFRLALPRGSASLAFGGIAVAPSPTLPTLSLIHI